MMPKRDITYVVQTLEYDSDGSSDWSDASYFTTRGEAKDERDFLIADGKRARIVMQ